MESHLQVLLHHSCTGGIFEPPWALPLPYFLLRTHAFPPLPPQLIPTLQVQHRGPFLWEVDTEALKPG